MSALSLSRTSTRSIGSAESRDFLRYLSSELNRLSFQLWNYAQFGIGGVTLWLVFGIPEAVRLRWIVIGMLAVFLFLTVWVTPQILSVGRNLDFVPRDPQPSELATFGFLHATYASLEMLKLVAGIVATV